MPTYLSEVQNEKRFRGNVVILIAGQYFAIRKPDSGLDIARPFDRCVSSLTLNPTQIDPRKVNTTVASYSFKLLDKYGAISALVQGNASDLMRQEVTIWLGRSGVNMDFSDYYQLPITRVKAITHADNSYSFQSAEETNRMDKPIFDLKNKLSGDILAGTTEITMQLPLTDWPTSGSVKIEDEYMSYTGLDLVNNRITGVSRGTLSSTPEAHDADSDVFFSETVTDNPLNIILKLLTSGGGGSAYDVLDDGLAISSSLIDITAIEELRDLLFDDVEFRLTLSNIESALKFIESELLFPNNLRFSFSRTTSKLTLVKLDKAEFVEPDGEIDEDTMVNFPSWQVDESRIINRIEVSWDYNEGTNTFQKFTVAEDADSISTYGDMSPLSLELKGVKESLDGQTIIDNLTSRLLSRLAFPTPEISVKTQLDKSLRTAGDKVLLTTSKVPALDGSLNFANELEVISRAINFQTGDVNFKLAFTSFTGIRSCYLAPSDSIQTAPAQNQVTVPAGRGDMYQVGWKLRLWDNALNDYTGDAVNTVSDISGDTITFEDDFTTPLTGPNDFRLKFANYDEVIDSQKRYCFLSDDGANFSDGKETYKVTY